MKEILEHRRIMAASGSADSENASEIDSDESWDSREDARRHRRPRPRRRKRRRRKGRRGSASDWSESSGSLSSSDSYSYTESSSEEELRRPSTKKRGQRRRHSADDSRKKTRSSRRESSSEDEGPKNPPTKPQKNFRDSVFSSYTSMKQAAVKLKYVEAKVKLQKQLEKEEELERQRQAAISKKKNTASVPTQPKTQPPKRAPVQPRGSTRGDLQIPPVPSVPSVYRPRPTSRPSITTARSSASGSVHLPTPPPRSYSAESSLPRHSGVKQSAPRTRSEDSAFVRGDHHDSGLQTSINRLLGTGPDNRSHSTMERQASNDFQASWLAPPPPSQPQPRLSASDSVYIPINKPRDRPTIAPGALQPAPPPKVKKSPQKMETTPAQPTVQAQTAIRGGGQKWADRLRSRR